MIVLKIQLPNKGRTLSIEAEDTMTLLKLKTNLVALGHLDATTTYFLKASSGEILSDAETFVGYRDQSFELITQAEMISHVAAREYELMKKREVLKQKLSAGEKVVVEKSGKLNPDKVGSTGDDIQIKAGKLASREEDLKRKRELLREKLKNGGKVVIEKSGSVNPDDKTNTGNNIQIKAGKLAFYWYENDPELFEAERRAMNQYFPQFEFVREGPGYWIGVVKPEVMGGTQWYLQLVYQNNHPSNDSFGGSVKVYSIEPDMDELVVEFSEAFGKPLPHVLTDAAGNKYMCTAEHKNFNDNKAVSVTTAASCLTWALKWIASYELVVAETDDRKRDDWYRTFANHGSSTI